MDGIEHSESHAPPPTYSNNIKKYITRLKYKGTKCHEFTRISNKLYLNYTGIYFFLCLGERKIIFYRLFPMFDLDHRITF